MSIETDGGRRLPSSRKFRAAPRLSEEVADAIRALILSGEVRGGDYLRVEQLAKDLGVSATPVREALLLLRGEGFVELQPRRGFIASSLRRSDIEDLFMVHGNVSSELAARAALRITPSELVLLQEIHDEVVAMLPSDNRAEAKRLTHNLHRTINKAARSPKLAWITGLVSRYPDKFFESVGGWMDHSVHDHERIIEALRTRDPEWAREETRSHFDHVAQKLIEHVDTLGLWTEEEILRDDA